MFTEEGHKAIAAWQKTHSIKCPICSCEKLDTASSFVTVTPCGPEGNLFVGKQSPMVQLTCTRCGHAMLFSAKTMGLVS